MVETPHVTIVKKTLEKEIESSPYKKTRTLIKEGESFLTIEIQSDDMRAVRGTFNSSMNWLITALESLSLNSL